MKDAKPTPEEEAVHAEVQAVLDRSTQILDELADYKGADEFIRNVCVCVCVRVCVCVCMCV